MKQFPQEFLDSMNESPEQVNYMDKLVLEDIPMPNIRNEWNQSEEKKELYGCGLYKNFTYDELCELASRYTNGEF